MITPTDEFSIEIANDLYPDLSQYAEGYFPYKDEIKCMSYHGVKLRHKMWSMQFKSGDFDEWGRYPDGRIYCSIPFSVIDERIAREWYNHNASDLSKNLTEFLVVPFRLVLVKNGGPSNTRVWYASEPKFIAFEGVALGSYTRAYESNFEEFLREHPSFNPLLIE